MLKRFAQYVAICCFFAWFLAACAPPTAVPNAEPIATEARFTGAVATAEVATVAGCAEGGPGVFTPEDVRCYLASFPPEFVEELGADTAVLFTNPNDITDWVGGAIIYHIPSVSSLVLDVHGDVDPQYNHIASRSALAAFNHYAGNPQRMAYLKQRVQQLWQTSDSGEPDVRLGLAWQEGVNSVFLVAIAGLPANDDRFYCRSEAWTIGDTEVHVMSECVAREADTLIPHLTFTAQEVRGDQPQQVQVALDGVASNEVEVVEGEGSVETAVYQAAITHITSHAVVLHGETTIPEDAEAMLENAIAPALLQNYLASNKSDSSLEFLFWNHQTIFVAPGWVIERVYLPPGGSTPDCTHFHREYPGLAGGVIRLSQIGFSDDGNQAIVFVQQECGAVAISSRYLLLQLQGEAWTAVDELGRVDIEAAAPLLPGLVYNGRSQGCGDIFVYKANDDETLSEFITLFIDARSFAFSEEPTSLDLADYWPAPALRIEVFGERIYNFGEFPYCNDVGPEAKPQTVWTAESGTITITIAGTIPEEPCNGEPYQVTIRLENVVFANGEQTIHLDEQLFEDVNVGWCAG